jgi:hypothetical protein
MEFVSHHLTRHHLLHAPHRWFFALLASPIHFAEMHYKKRYHLTFVHAKKLFAFDISLIVSIFILIITTISWFTYDPTIVRWVDLSIHSSAPAERTRSGEKLTYLIEYKNRSKTELHNPKLTLQLPATFLIQSVNPDNIFDQNTKTFSLPNLAPGSSGSTSLTGLFYGNVNQEYHVLTTLSYQQAEKKTSEQKLTNTITVLRDSVLEPKIEAPVTILSHSTVPIVITLKNNSELPLTAIAFPLTPTENFTLTPDSPPAKGMWKNDIWYIEELRAGEEASLKASLTSHIQKPVTQSLFLLTPIITIQNQALAQLPAQHNFQVIQPKAELSAVWTGELAPARPGETLEIAVGIKNNGTTELNNLMIELPIPADIVDIASLSSLNSGKYSAGIFTITSAFYANLKNLKPSDTTVVIMNIPIRSQIVNGTDVALALHPKLTAEVPNVTSAKYEIEAYSPAVNIGTNLFLTAESRYYTAEGDQLGRGPLPPKVGEETKYWAIVNIKNTTSKTTALTFSALLPPHITWTGRSSVTHGADIFFNPANRTINWNTGFLNPHETVGLYMELAFTPTTGQIGTTPLLLQNLRISAKDSITGSEINKTTPNIDISLPQDEIGKRKGTLVQ